MNHSKKHKKTDTTKHPLIFKIIVILIPVLILVIFEGILRLANYGDDLHLFIKNPEKGYEKFMMVNPIIGKKYFQKFEYTTPPNDIFYAKKPENTFRIFVMGSSTVYGFPYDRNLMFSRILNQQLADSYPDKKIEVVNTAITAINSFTLLDYVNEILKYQPDAVLIYAGHNEFYGAFGIGSNETMSKNRGLTRLHIFLMDFRLYQLLRNVISSVAEKFSSRYYDNSGTLMKRMVANADILLNSDEYNIAMKRYQQNMDEILKKFKRKNVPVFLSDLVSNVKDIEPFNSIAENSLPPAIEVYKSAKTAENLQDFKKAESLYYQAKDLDCIRFRASEDVNRIIDEEAEKYQDYKVPMLDWFKQHSENGLIGNNLMTEHVHPNINGIFLMAQAFFNKIKDSGVVGKADDQAEYSMEYYKRNWGYTVLDSLIAYHRIQTLKGYWPFVKAGEKEVNHLQSYKPKLYLDSIAFSVLKDPKRVLGDARLDLAKTMLKQGEAVLAYREYEALLRTNPYVAVNYRDAANCLIQLGDLPKALKYYKASMEYDTSFIALYRIGEINLIKGDYENAIRYFKQSFKLAPEENKVNVLGKTYVADVYSNRTEDAKVVAAKLKSINAAALLKVPPKKYVYSQYVPFQTRPQVLKASELANEKKYKEAIELLKSSLDIYDSHIAKRFIGEIYYEQRDLDNALFYFQKVYDEFKFDPTFLNRLVIIYHEKKDDANARKYIQEIKRIAPDYAELENLTKLVS